MHVADNSNHVVSCHTKTNYGDGSCLGNCHTPGHARILSVSDLTVPPHVLTKHLLSPWAWPYTWMFSFPSYKPVSRNYNNFQTRLEIMTSYIATSWFRHVPIQCYKNTPAFTYVGVLLPVLAAMSAARVNAYFSLHSAWNDQSGTTGS